VLVWSPSKDRKLAPHWKGPMRVLGMHNERGRMSTSLGQKWKVACCAGLGASLSQMTCATKESWTEGGWGGVERVERVEPASSPSSCGGEAGALLPTVHRMPDVRVDGMASHTCRLDACL
jgi:hypothetical protein